MTQATGGFVIHKAPLIRGGMHAHTALLERPVSQLDLDGLNAVQATQWRINRWLLDVAMDAWTSNIKLPFLERTYIQSTPDRLSDAHWGALDADSKKQWLRGIADIHAENARKQSRERALLDYLTVAKEMEGYASIWFPHSRCFRGRIHPISTMGPNPQANDFGKSLLMFATGLPLGPDGLFWLCVRAASCAGMDKLPLVDRVQWVMDHQTDIARIALDPIRCRDLWVQADDPWQFLATCHELAQAWSAQDPDEFVSHLPIQLDG